MSDDAAQWAPRHHPPGVNRCDTARAIVDVVVGRGARTGIGGSGVLKGILNIIWLVLEGLWMAIAYVLAGIICFVLIITIPFGIASFRIAGYVLWPFGRTVERRPDAGAGSMIGNVLWVILFGWWLALGHLIAGVALCVTIIGIPLGIASFKIIPITLLPLGTQIVPTGQAYSGRAY
jgi:uncharacterized membrane protein YccF (DUF307 family)